MIDPLFKIKTINEEDGYAKLSIEPLEQGYGNTLGNALRRVLLSSLQGVAVTYVKFDHVKHPFSTIAGMKEDVVELILNIKKIRLQLDTHKEFTLKLDVKGPKEVTAQDLQLPAGVTVVNKDQYLATLSDKKAKLSLTLTISSGYGYEPSEDKKRREYGIIPIDSLFSPIIRVNYKVEATRVGRMTNLDKLILDIWTDKTVKPQEAVKQAAKILADYFLQIHSPQEKITEASVDVKPSISEEVLNMTIEELDIPMRIANSLKNGEIETVRQLINVPSKELSKIKNLGIKSLQLIKDKLKEKGVNLVE